ncbi:MULTISPECIES: hypothetical protein [Photorhabdus]|nr:hypothetical protein [Photorhabdus asymbiotica]
MSDVDWMVWTPIMRNLCTLHELRTVYSLSDVIDMHEAIAETLLSEKRANDADRRTSGSHRR